MATIPTPYTAAVGNFMTAALWNAQVRDSVTFLTHVPVFKGVQTTGQSITSQSNPATSVLLDTESLDPDGGHSTTVNTSRFTVQTAGVYQVNASLGYGNLATGNRMVGIQVNGTPVVQNAGAGMSGNSWSGSVSWLGSLAVGDYVEMITYHTIGSPQNLATSGASQPQLSLFWISA
jgi:hypothetical protein